MAPAWRLLLGLKQLRVRVAEGVPDAPANDQAVSRKQSLRWTVILCAGLDGRGGPQCRIVLRHQALNLAARVASCAH